MSFLQNNNTMGTVPQGMYGIPPSMQDVLDQDIMAGKNMDMLTMDLDFDGPHADFTTMTINNNNNMQPLLQRTDTDETITDSNNTMTGAGAGPLPTGFGIAPPISGTATTEFTKRRNWSQRVIEEIKDLLHVLTPDGRILYVSSYSKNITGHDPHTLVGKFIGEFVHPDDRIMFMREFNESIATGNSLRFYYRFKRDDGTYVILECDGHPHMAADQHREQITNGNNPTPSTGNCRGFFMMARSYPTSKTAMLDSFLEHKIDNVRLLTRIEELKREEADEQATNPIATTPHDPEPSIMTDNPHQFTGNVGEPARPIQPPDFQGMPPPAKPSVSNAALTRQNLDSVLSVQRPDSMADKMSRYEGSNHFETIEMLTGLQYRDGERSHGISTGDTSPALIGGDASIAMLADRDRDGGNDRKKLRLADEFVCADCGTLDSPEWRKGPKGPKTLCNACGLRWAKKEKRRESGPTSKERPSSVGDVTPGFTTPNLIKQDNLDSV